MMELLVKEVILRVQYMHRWTDRRTK